MVATSRNVTSRVYRDILLYVDDDLVHAATQQANSTRRLDQGSSSADSSLSQLSAVLHSFSGGPELINYDAPREPLQRRFEIMARTTPGATAVAFNGRRLTYGELDEQADALALHLQGSGLAPGSYCMVDLAPSIAQIRTVLAVLKAGAACLHIDGRVVREATAAVLAVLGPTLCFTRRAGPPDSAPSAMRTIRCDEDPADLPYGWANELPVGARTPACAFASISRQGDLCISVRTHHAIGLNLERDPAPRRTHATDADAEMNHLWRPLSTGAQLTIPA